MDPQYKVFFRNFPEKNLVLQILNDERSWGTTLSETKSIDDSDWVVSMMSSDALQKRFPGQDGTLSITLFEENKAPETFFHAENWKKSPNPAFSNQMMYKTYLVNHEFGHVLMYGHRKDKAGYCYVMYQQTKPGKCWPCPWPKLCGDIEDDIFDSK